MRFVTSLVPSRLSPRHITRNFLSSLSFLSFLPPFLFLLRRFSFPRTCNSARGRSRRGPLRSIDTVGRHSDKQNRSIRASCMLCGRWRNHTSCCTEFEKIIAHSLCLPVSFYDRVQYNFYNTPRLEISRKNFPAARVDIDSTLRG